MVKYGYDGKATTWSNFQKVRNKRIFTIMAKRYRDEYPDFIKFSLYGNDVNWVGDLQDEKIVDEFWEHRRYLESISRAFEKQLDGIRQVMYNNQISFKDIFINNDVLEIPIIERMYIQGFLKIETLLILHRLMNWMNKVECSNPIWEVSKARKLKYNAFLNVDNVKVKKIFLKNIENNT